MQVSKLNNQCQTRKLQVPGQMKCLLTGWKTFQKVELIHRNSAQLKWESKWLDCLSLSSRSGCSIKGSVKDKLIRHSLSSGTYMLMQGMQPRAKNKKVMKSLRMAAIGVVMWKKCLTNRFMITFFQRTLSMKCHPLKNTRKRWSKAQFRDRNTSANSSSSIGLTFMSQLERCAYPYGQA